VRLIASLEGPLVVGAIFLHLGLVAAAAQRPPARTGELFE
jgi:hypothetical protein